MTNLQKMSIKARNRNLNKRDLIYEYSEIILLIESIPVYGWAVVLILAVAVCLLALNTKMNIMINIEKSDTEIPARIK